MVSIKVHEAQVEDALATYPTILANLVGVQRDVSLLFRQHPLPSGRLDLLYACGTELFLVELKVESFRYAFLEQVLGYMADIRAMQEQGSLMKTPTRAYLLCPSFLEHQLLQCQEAGVSPIVYSPEDVLQSFFLRLRGIARFVSIKPNYHGVWSIRLIHRFLYGLLKARDAQELADSSSVSAKTVTNNLRLARDLFLANHRDRKNWALSELGVRYVAARDPHAPVEAISDAQRQILRDFIIKDPFASPTVFGIYAIVECVFTLARNRYPVEASTLLTYFRDTCGKAKEWLTQTALMHGVHMYSNYAVELGLLAKVDNRFLLTPDGVRFVLLLQLHKGIAMVDAVGVPWTS